MVIAAALLILLITTACNHGNNSHYENSPMSQTTSSDPEAALRSKPPFEHAQQQYREAVQDMAYRISAIAPGLTWKFKEDSWRGCSGEYAKTSGVHVYIYALFDGPLPDDAWGQAVDIVQAGVSDLGATNMTTLIDKPGDHYVVLGGPDGIKIEFGTKAATVFAVTSDCRLREADLAAPPER